MSKNAQNEIYGIDDVDMNQSNYKITKREPARANLLQSRENKSHREYQSAYITLHAVNERERSRRISVLASDSAGR
jgi:hypothetical protein